MRLPRRFHENPLVVPSKVWIHQFDKQLSKNQLPAVIKKAIADQRKTGFPLLIFAPEIAKGKELSSIIRHYYPREKIGFVSSQTEDRLKIVEQFRSGEIGILISTTILERGVTFPCVDVFVLQANHRLYTSSSLVQISGRVGRSVERPTGLLFFFLEETNKAIDNAIKEIKLMNKEAGY